MILGSYDFWIILYYALLPAVTALIFINKFVFLNALINDNVNCKNFIASATDEWIHNTGERLTEAFGIKLVPMPLCPPQIPHGQTWNQTWDSAVTGSYLYGNSSKLLLSPLINQAGLLL